MDVQGYSYQSFKDFIKEIGYIRQDEACIGNIELWTRGSEPFTFSITTASIHPNRIDDLLDEVGSDIKAFKDFLSA